MRAPSERLRGVRPQLESAFSQSLGKRLRSLRTTLAPLALASSHAKGAPRRSELPLHSVAPHEARARGRSPLHSVNRGGGTRAPLGDQRHKKGVQPKAWFSRRSVPVRCVGGLGEASSLGHFPEVGKKALTCCGIAPQAPPPCAGRSKTYAPPASPSAALRGPLARASCRHRCPATKRGSMALRSASATDCPAAETAAEAPGPRARGPTFCGPKPRQ